MGTDYKHILIAAHRPLAGDQRFPNSKPRGGESSVAMIRDFLAKRYVVMTAVHGRDDFREYAKWADVVITWGSAAEPAAEACRMAGVPYIVMIRWFRNIVPLPPGDIRSRTIPDYFQKAKYRLLSNASDVISNNQWTADTVKMKYGVTSLVSYVPVDETIAGHGNPHGPVVLVTDGKQLGAEQLLDVLAPKSGRQFMVVNAKDPSIYRKHANIMPTGYQSSMKPIWNQAGLMIYPNYHNDVCGTSRCGPEFMRYGVPALANDRCGICEKGMLPLKPDAEWTHWMKAIEDTYRHYRSFSDKAIQSIREYDTAGQLAVYEAAINRALGNSP